MEGLVISGYTLYCDIDDTLIMWNGHEINEECQRELMRHFKRGHNIVFWSAGGGDWALDAAVYADVAWMGSAFMSKPYRFLDDLPASNFMPERARTSYYAPPGLLTRLRTKLGKIKDYMVML